MTSENISSPEAKIGDAVAAACDVLKLPSEARKTLLRPFENIARDYMNTKSVAGTYEPAKEQMRYITRLRNLLDSVNLHLLAIAPDYLIALDSWLYEGPGIRPDILTTREQLQRLHRDVDQFLNTFKAKRGPPVNIALEEAIRAILPLLEETLGEVIEVAQNKHTGDSPSMKSRGARAIAVMLRSVDPTLSETAIANMVERVRAQPRPTETNEDRLTKLMSELDLCLLPNRREGLRD